MKKVDLVISWIDDAEPFPRDDELDRGRIRLRVWMTGDQIAYNQMVLFDEQTKNRGIPKIRAVK